VVAAVEAVAAAAAAVGLAAGVVLVAVLVWARSAPVRGRTVRGRRPAVPRNLPLGYGVGRRA